MVGAMIFLFYPVLTKLAFDWWMDENYSHGLLVPFVLGFIIWNERDRLIANLRDGAVILGSVLAAMSFFLLAAGTLGAELFTQRLSLVLMIIGVVAYFFGTKILKALAVPFALLILAIPIPQILFNRFAFPLQIWASKIAVWGIRLFDVPVVRKGNVIDILPSGSTQTLSLEVVEACSGIRSLMTLVTLALILAYFTRNIQGRGIGGFSTTDFWRATVLMVAAVPIAVMTNAARVSATGILTFYYGKQATEKIWHDASGWLVYIVALGLMIGINLLLKRLFRSSYKPEESFAQIEGRARIRSSVLPLLAALVIGGIAVNWFVSRDEVKIPRRPLAELSKSLGDWQQKGEEIRFGPETESVLRTTDYSMREYSSPDGRIANLYVGYYESQRTGATYHSPQNCLPGAGWILGDSQTIEIRSGNGKTFRANRYTIENGIYREVMIYWYQGRGRTEASEYSDKLNTIWDSVTRRRTDGSIVRVMTSVGNDETAAIEAAIDLSSRLSESLGDFVPE